MLDTYNKESLLSTTILEIQFYLSAKIDSTFYLL